MGCAPCQCGLIGRMLGGLTCFLVVVGILCLLSFAA